jgi:hypothetical protein
MIYEANKTEWKPGDIVIHDADSKDHKMLMVILGETIHPNGSREWRTQYLNPKKLIPHCIMVKYGSYERIPKRLTKQSRKVWLNELKYLHDPARFDIVITENDRTVAEAFLK